MSDREPWSDTCHVRSRLLLSEVDEDARLITDGPGIVLWLDHDDRPWTRFSFRPIPHRDTESARHHVGGMGRRAHLRLEVLGVSPTGLEGELPHALPTDFDALGMHLLEIWQLFIWSFEQANINASHGCSSV